MKSFNWDDFSFYYTDHIHVPLPEGHRFPMEKYRLLRQQLLKENILSETNLHQAPLADDVDLLRAHSEKYVFSLKNNTISAKELRPIGLTWGPELLARSYSSVGGFVEASLSAKRDGFSALLAGGTHHAHYDRGEGYCVFNDFAVAGLKLLESHKARKILIIDLDVHQGNGNSSILGNRDDFFIMSFHGEKNYPFRKVPSHLDVSLPPETEDEEYLELLSIHLKDIAQKINFDFIFYQAGVDSLKEDKLGTLSLTHSGLRKRDEMIFKLARERDVPLAMAIGGGYSSPIELTVSAHVETFKVAQKIFS